jgi:hypothetical protein
MLRTAQWHALHPGFTIEKYTPLNGWLSGIRVVYQMLKRYTGALSMASVMPAAKMLKSAASATPPGCYPLLCTLADSAAVSLNHPPR